MAEREDLSGRTLGEFVLRERIDEGGFGAVYRCEQPLLGREAVVKVLHRRLRRNDVVLQRFMREAQLASRLDHPYAAHVYAFGIEHDDGLFWIAMEMVQGTALNRWLRERGPLALDQLVPFFECVAEVVQTAHDRGIVHRDLKPSNVMVIERAGRLLPKLLDFGVAKLLGETALPAPPRIATQNDGGTTEAADCETCPSEAVTLTASTTPPQRRDLQHRLTHADSTIGSPPYMSPEQWNNAVTVGPASDLYALGVVAYEALTGRRPFIASTVTEYADLHCNGVVPALGLGLPPALDRLFERALAKRPEQRWSSALELAAALRAASGVGGNGGHTAELPRLDDTVRDAWLSYAPQPLAELVDALDHARNVHHVRDAARDLMRGLLRHLLALALATRAQVRDDRADPAVLERVRTMRHRELVAAERVHLLRLLVRPLAGRRGAHPIPELVDLVTPHADTAADDLDPILAMLPPSDQPATEDVVRARLVELMPELTRVLRRMAFMLDYALVVPRGDVVERWTGPRRPRRVLAAVNGGELVVDHPMLLDRKGRVCVDLWPLVQVVAPSEGREPELFVFESRGRHGARLCAAPSGHELFDPRVWDWIASRVLAEADAGDRGADEPAPYLGLAPYAAGDAARFVGREAEVEGVVERLRQRPLQLVVGPSGAGKTSFVHAGVIPRLPAGWRAVTLRPGAAPLAALASRLAAAGVATPELRGLLASSPVTAAAHVAEAAGAGAIVLVVDELQELFTLCGCADERGQFAAAIAQLAASADLPVRVIATIRDDFVAALDALPALRALLLPAVVQLGNPTRDDLVRVVVEPAARAGYALSDPELAQDMVSAVVNRPGALALLSFTASRLWELRDRTFHQLTRSAYDAMGGVAGALVRHAEDTYAGLAGDDQRLAGDVFRHLVTADGARAQLSGDELRQRLASPHAGAVIDKLVAARLLAMAESEAETGSTGDDESHVEIIHDALLDGWPRLQRWIREDVDGARMRDQLRAAARRWSEADRARGLLWRHGMLVDLERWLRRGKAVALTDVEAAFVDASQRLARRARIRRRLGLVAIGFAIAFAVFGVRAMQSRIEQRVLERQLTQTYADWGQLSLLEGKYAEALIYLEKAASQGGGSRAVDRLRALAAQPFQHEIAQLRSSHGEMWWAAYSSDGRSIVTTDEAGAQIWDALAMTVKFSLPHGAVVYQAAFTPDGATIVTTGGDSTVKVWDATNGRLLRSLRSRRPNDAMPFPILAISPAGTQVAGIDETGGFVDVWDLRTGSLIQELIDDRPASSHPSLEFSRDGCWLATSAGDDVRIYDTASWSRVLDIPGPGVVALSFDPTAPRLATATSRGEVSIWGVPGGVRIWHLRDSGDPLDHVAFSPDGARVAAAGHDGTERVWNARSGELEFEIKDQQGPLTWIEFGPSSRLLVSASKGGEVAIADVVVQRTVSTLAGSSGRIRTVHFDPRSPRVIAPSWDGTARIWDTKWSYLRWATPRLGQDCASTLRPEPDSRFVVVACSKQGTWVWDTADPVEPHLLAKLPSPTEVQGDFLSAYPVVDAAGDRAAIATGDTVTIYALPAAHVVATVRHPGPVTTVAFAASGRDLMTGSVDGSLRITPDGRPSFTLATLHAAVDVVGFLPDGRVIAADAVPRLHVYEVAQRTSLAEIELPGRVTAFRSSMDSRRLLTIPIASIARPPVLWDLDGYRQISVLVAEHGPVFSARFTERDTRILAASTAGTTRVWDAADGQFRKSYFRTEPVLFDAALDPSETFVVTAGGDDVLRFWDTASGRMIWTLKAHQSSIAGVHFEGNDLVTRGFAGEIARWSISVPPSSELDLTIARILRCLPVRFDEQSRGLVEQDRRCDK